MGNSKSKNTVPVIAQSSVPAYCIRSIGCRHFLVAGGGGAVKSGVKNEIELFLLTYDQFTEFGKKLGQLKGRQTGVIETGIHANMNMDIIPLGPPETGKYLIAVGQDQFCTIYESDGFCLKDEEDELEVPSKLSLNFQCVAKIVTDFKTPVSGTNSADSYQNCVRLYHSNNVLQMVTGGSDGSARIWSIGKISEEHSTINLRPDLEVVTGEKLIDSLDVSKCAKILSTITANETAIWDLTTGTKVCVLQDLPQLGHDYKIRSLRFLGFDKSGRNSIFIACYNKRVRTNSKEVSYLALWAFSKQEKVCHLIKVKLACKEAISCLAVSECGNFTAIGTMAGSVAIFDTHNLDKPLLYVPQTHSSFVTAVDFLPKRSYDTEDLGRLSVKKQEDGQLARCFLPGVCADSRCSILSLSVDQTIQLHEVPYPSAPTITGYLVKLALITLLLYFVCWLVLYMFI